MKLPVLINYSLGALILISACFSPFSLGGCKNTYLDKKRDLPVTAYEKVKKVLKQELRQTEDQLLMNQKLSTLGVNDDNKVRLQRALKNEFGISLPYSHLGHDETVGTIVRYMASYENSAFEEEDQYDRKGSAVPDSFGNLIPENKQVGEEKKEVKKAQTTTNVERSEIKAKSIRRKNHKVLLISASLKINKSNTLHC